MQTLSKWVFICMSLLWATNSHAQRVVPVPALTAYQQECSVCHFAYPPGLLPAESWKSITDSLPKHFSTQVLLNSDTQSVIADWLQTNAELWQLLLMLNQLAQPQRIASPRIQSAEP